MITLRILFLNIRWGILILAVLAIGVAACSDNEENTNSSANTPLPTTTATASPMPAAAPGSCDPVTGLCMPDAQGNVMIEENDGFLVAQKFAGVPGVWIPARVGQQINLTAKNVGSTNHNIHLAGPDNRFDTDFCKRDGAEPCSDPDSIASGQSGKVTFRFEQTGTYQFRCDFHPGSMFGVVQVTQ